MKRFIIQNLKHMDFLEMKVIQKLNIPTLKVVKNLKKVRLVENKNYKNTIFALYFYEFNTSRQLYFVKNHD